MRPSSLVATIACMALPSCSKPEKAKEAEKTVENQTVAVAPNGEVFITGYFEGETDFGGSIGKKQSAGKSDAFVAKLGADGKHTTGMQPGL